MQSDALRALPASWRTCLAKKTVIPIAAGMSGACVFLVRDAAADIYLKIGIGALVAPLMREIARTDWLGSNDIRVPRIVARFADRDVVAVAMTGLGARSGEDIDARKWQGSVSTIARAFAHLHSLALATCPFDHTLGVRLARARPVVQSGGVDPGDFDRRNVGLTPRQLYDRLEATAPAHQDLVVTHGDATLSNIVFNADGHVGLIDCGNCGTADRYVDLALLVGELEERFGRKARNTFLEAYGGLVWDEDKALYYLDLYELFDG